MKFKFDANQQYQLDAIGAAVELFKGQKEKSGMFEKNYNIFGLGVHQNELGLCNEILLDEETIQDNLCNVQKSNTIPAQDTIKSKGLNFSIEMETGTGKTYIYLRTAFELNKIYGIKKFVFV